MDLEGYFASLSLDELWDIHERISDLLEARIIAEKQLIEKQLSALDAEKQTIEGRNGNDEDG
jgi:DNA-binding protein H-NS